MSQYSSCERVEGPRSSARNSRIPGFGVSGTTLSFLSLDCFASPVVAVGAGRSTASSSHPEPVKATAHLFPCDCLTSSPPAAPSPPFQNSRHYPSILPYGASLPGNPIPRQLSTFGNLPPDWLSHISRRIHVTHSVITEQSQNAKNTTQQPQIYDPDPDALALLCESAVCCPRGALIARLSCMTWTK